MQKLIRHWAAVLAVAAGIIASNEAGFAVENGVGGGEQRKQLLRSTERLARTEHDVAAMCEGLVWEDFSRIPDAPSQVLESRWVSADDNGPERCEMEGRVTPQVGFALLLPTKNWNGKYLMIGCGGWCGDYDRAYSVCPFYLRRGYACISTDMGHQGKAYEAKWAYNNLQAEVDLAFRGTHVATLAGKAITEYFFERKPERSYYMGCSQGGRQGLSAAQRFPYDFDGIVIGAPGGLTQGAAPLYIIWALQSSHDSQGKALFQRSDLELLHRAAIARCDANDGVRDGVIGNPERCPFHPREVMCSGSVEKDCLTPAQVAAAEKIYAGPMTSSGKMLSSGGPAPGSELTWFDMFVDKTSRYAWIAREAYRYLFFTPDLGPTWEIEDFDFDKDPQRTVTMSAMYETSNPDLRDFKDNGGKILFYHGWNDQGVPPARSIDYYEMVTRTMGGREQTEDFFRLFMVPGLYHCSGGEGAHAVDYLPYLETWVEKGVAPDKLLAARPRDSKLSFGAYTHSFDFTKDEAEYTRPLFPYPSHAVYSGQGDPSEADSYIRATD